jgi:hypothetical protein
MSNESQDRVVYSVTYSRQPGSNQWSPTITEEPGMTAMYKEGGMGTWVTFWEGRTTADEVRARTYVSVERDPRFYELSPELGEARTAMVDKVTQIADAEFLQRYPGAEIRR